MSPVRCVCLWCVRVCKVRCVCGCVSVFPVRYVFLVRCVCVGVCVSREVCVCTGV